MVVLLLKPTMPDIWIRRKTGYGEELPRMNKNRANATRRKVTID